MADEKKHTAESVAAAIARALLKAPAMNRQGHREKALKSAGKKKAARKTKP